MSVLEEKSTKEGLTITLNSNGAIGLSDTFGEVGINPEDMEEFDRIYKKARKIVFGTKPKTHKKGKRG